MSFSSLLPASLTWTSLAALVLLALAAVMLPAYLATWLVPWWQSRNPRPVDRVRPPPPRRRS